MARAAAAFVLVVLALPLASCGGGGAGGVPQAPLAAAAAATRDSETLRFSMSGAFEFAGHSSAFEGHGVADNSSGRSSMSLSSQSAVGGDQTDTEMVSDGSVLYLRSPELGRWIKFDFAKLDEDLGGDFGSMLLVGGRSDPVEVLAYLDAAGSVEVVGTERVRGVETTHYRGKVDFALYADLLEEDDADAAQGIRELVEEAGGSLIVPLDVWVDDDDHVRRESYELSVAREFSMKATMELYDFGAELDIEVPKGDVTDLTEILEEPGG
jgi:hypothetical protein